MYWRYPKNRLIVLLVSVVCVAPLVVGAALFYGAVDLDWHVLFRSQKLLDDSVNQTIFYEIRLPRVVSAFFVGGLLSMAGLMMQALLKNPLADPYILGVSAGAGLGGLLMSLFVPALALYWAQPLGAGIGALVVVLLVFGMAAVNTTLSPERFLLIGVAISALCSAFISLLLVMLESHSFRGFVFWLLGALNGDHWQLLLMTWVVVLMILLPLARAMNSFVFGDDLAYSVGVNVQLLRWQLYWMAALATGIAVSAGGMIGFVGLVIPHVMRLFFGMDHRILVPACALMGGVFLILSDLLARVLIAPEQLPIGVVTALIGAPVFIILLIKQSNVRLQKNDA